MNEKTKTITRRAAIGVGVAGLASSGVILSVLRGRYEVIVPEGHSGTVGGKIAMNYEGEEVTIDIPRMELKTLEDEERFKEIAIQQLKESPVYDKVNRSRVEDWKERSTNSVMATLDESEKEGLESIAERVKTEGLGKSEEQALVKQLRDQIQAARAGALEQISGARIPASQ